MHNPSNPILFLDKRTLIASRYSFYLALEQISHKTGQKVEDIEKELFELSIKYVEGLSDKKVDTIIDDIYQELKRTNL